jgi:hypothetical protein
MFSGILRWFAARFRSGEDTTDEGSEESEESEESRFVPSVLDWSVRYGHGGGNAEAEREIANIEEKAQQIEKHQRRK